jgi:hypothetical protein
MAATFFVSIEVTDLAQGCGQRQRRGGRRGLIWLALVLLTEATMTFNLFIGMALFCAFLLGMAVGAGMSALAERR